MTGDMTAGFEEVEHTADWELHAWSPDLPTLFEQVARGMYMLSGTQIAREDRRTQTIELDAADAESLLVGFLAELLFLAEQDGLAFHRFDLRIDEDPGQNRLQLTGQMEGGRIIAQAKEIKAVTYHRLQIERSDRGLEVRVVFDV